MRVKLTMEGKANLRAGMRRLRASILTQGADILEKVADRYSSEVRHHMGVHSSGGPFGWEPLSDKWLAIKADNRWPLEIWEATGETKAAVEAGPVLRRGKVLSVFAGISGVESTGFHREQPIDKAIHVEFGDPDWFSPITGNMVMRGIPARPLFKPVALQIAGEIASLHDGVGYQVRVGIERAALLAREGASRG